MDLRPPLDFVVSESPTIRRAFEVDPITPRMSASGGKRIFVEGIVRSRPKVNISSFKRMFSRRPRVRRAGAHQFPFPRRTPRPAIRPATPTNSSGNLSAVRALGRSGRACLGGRLDIFCSAVGGTTVEAKTIRDLQQMSIDQFTGTREAISAASRYIVWAHGLSEKNITPDLPNMLLVCGA